MNRSVSNKERIRALLADVKPREPLERALPRWVKVSLIGMAGALIIQTVAIAAILKMREPMRLGMDPYGNPVVAAPADRPLTGKLYDTRGANFTRVTPAGNEWFERNSAESFMRELPL